MLTISTLVDNNADASAPQVTPEELAKQTAILARSVAKAKRIAVVAGAGISCAAGIPDFRSGDGLFRTLKDRNPKAGLSSGKDLFSASLFQSEANTALYYEMIAELSRMAQQAEPTIFHRLLKLFDDQGKLFRVYTQNIDSLEQKAGLSFGLGDREERHPSSPRKKRKLDDEISGCLNVVAGTSRSPSRSVTPQPPTNAKGTPKKRKPDIPRCIPLHGSLQTLSCSKCSHQESMNNPLHLAELTAGRPVQCPSCLVTDQSRQSSGQRSRGLGMMKPSVVLYGDASLDLADTVGRITERDLMATPRPDLLIIAGTSLKVPGTKRLVKELAKVTNSALSLSPATMDDFESLPDAKVIFLNYEFPSTASKEWSSLVDVFFQGDVQSFASVVLEQEAILANQRADKDAKKLGIVGTQSTSVHGNRLAVELSNKKCQSQPRKKAQQKVKGLKPRKETVKKPKPGWEILTGPGWNCFAEVEILETKRTRKPTKLFGPTEVVLSAPQRRQAQPKSTITVEVPTLSQALNVAESVSAASTPSEDGVSEDEKSEKNQFKISIPVLTSTEKLALSLPVPALKQQKLTSSFAVVKGLRQTSK